MLGWYFIVKSVPEVMMRAFIESKLKEGKYHPNFSPPRGGGEKEGGGGGGGEWRPQVQNICTMMKDFRIASYRPL